jgi:hypothetical protein
MVILIVILYIVVKNIGSSVKEFSANLLDYLNSFKVFADNPYSIFSVIIFLLALYTVIFIVKIPMTNGLKPISIMIVETVTILAFIVLLIINFFKYILNVDLLDIFKNELNHPIKTEPSEPKDEEPIPTCRTVTEPPPEGEVFNIRNNLYTYDEAREVCSIYGANLATYDQIENAYNNGGEWCNYGWSEGQMALFPTQKETWDASQEKNGSCNSKKINNACGRPGINGGIIKNPKIRFGVNCYGKKPQPSDSEQSLMKANIEPKVTESKKDIELKAKINVWKENSDKFLLVNSFNKKKWSE